MHITIDSNGNILIPIVIRGSYRDHYEVPPIHTEDDLSQWLTHLREKNWFTPDLEAHFVAVCRSNITPL